VELDTAVPPLTHRRGAGLAELVVALSLASVVAAVAVAGLAQHQRAQQRRETAALAEQISHDALRVLRAQLTHALDAPRLLGDTAVQLRVLRGAAKACAADPARLTFPSEGDWWSAPRTGDSLAVTDTLSGIEWKASVVATTTLRASASCPAGGTRLTLSGLVPSTVPSLLLPARVWHTVRLALYRASDGQWWLGERLCTPVCGAMQPIAGPLRSPAEGGLRLTRAPDDGTGPVRLDVRVRPAVAGHEVLGTARLSVGAAP
jgi:type II secretory pathway pseudopilin PulG